MHIDSPALQICKHRLCTCQILCLIPKLHMHGHKDSCQYKFSLNHTQCCGQMGTSEYPIWIGALRHIVYPWCIPQDGPGHSFIPHWNCLFGPITYLPLIDESIGYFTCESVVNIPIYSPVSPLLSIVSITFLISFQSYYLKHAIQKLRIYSYIFPIKNAFYLTIGTLGTCSERIKHVPTYQEISSLGKSHLKCFTALRSALTI